MILNYVFLCTDQQRLAEFSVTGGHFGPTGGRRVAAATDEQHRAGVGTTGGRRVAGDPDEQHRAGVGTTGGRNARFVDLTAGIGRRVAGDPDQQHLAGVSGGQDRKLLVMGMSDYISPILFFFVQFANCLLQLS